MSEDRPVYFDADEAVLNFVRSLRVERDEARKEVAALTERRQRLLTTVRGSFKKLRRLRDVWRDTENSVQALLLEMTQQCDEARKERDGWRVSEQETSRDYHEMRDLNTKVRSILRAPLDTTTDDAAWGVVHERDRLYAEVKRLTAERKDILDQRDKARQQRDEAQKLAVDRGELIEGLKHDLKRSDAECQKAWEHRDALASRFRSIDRVLMIETGDAEVTLQAVQKAVYDRDQAVRERDGLREQWVEPREKAKYKCTPARRGARDRVPLDGAEAQALEHALTITERERDQASEQAAKLAQELEQTKTLLAEDRAELRELRDRERDVELDPLLPSVLSWVRRETSSELVFWEVLYESLIVGRVEQCRARGPLLGWWIWERLDGAREQGAEPDALKARGKLARHLRAHLPLAAAAPAEPEPDPDPKLPPGLRWVRVIFALGSYCWEVFDGAVAIARVEPSGPPNGCSDGWGWRWKFLGQPVPKRPTWGNTPDEYGARAVLARYLRAEATATKKRGDIFAIPPGLSWRVVGAFKVQVVKTDGEVVAESVPDGTDRWSWWMTDPRLPLGLKVSGEGPSEPEARAGLAAFVREAYGSCEPPPDFSLPQGLIWMKLLEDGAWNWGVYRDGSPLGRLLAKVMQHQNLMGVWYWTLFSYVIDEDSQGIIDGPSFGSQHAARLALANLLRRIGAGSNG